MCPEVLALETWTSWMNQRRIEFVFLLLYDRDLMLGLASLGFALRGESVLERNV